MVVFVEHCQTGSASLGSGVMGLSVSGLCVLPQVASLWSVSSGDDSSTINGQRAVDTAGPQNEVSMTSEERFKGVYNVYNASHRCLYSTWYSRCTFRNKAASSKEPARDCIWSASFTNCKKIKEIIYPFCGLIAVLYQTSCSESFPFDLENGYMFLLSLIFI